MPAELGDLAGLVHAHLDHGDAVPRLEAEEHHRHADAVVEVALRAGISPGKSARGARRGDAGGGLAGRSGDADERPRPARGAPAAGVGAAEIAERDVSV